jgi:4a-hydroxytetrahydrobiopterin dehydratase
MVLSREVVATSGDIHMWSTRRCVAGGGAEHPARVGRRLTIESIMPNALAAKSCTPCRGGIPPLTIEEVQGYLAQAPDWDLLDDDRKIQRTYRFRNFREALGFVQRAGELVEAGGHHPDILFGWGYATVSLQTKKIKGCTRTTSSWRRSSTASRRRSAGSNVTSRVAVTTARASGSGPCLREECLTHARSDVPLRGGVVKSQRSHRSRWPLLPMMWAARASRLPA